MSMRIRFFALTAAWLAISSGAVLNAEDWLDRAQSKYDEKAGLALIQAIQADRSASNGELSVGIVYHNLARLNPQAYLKAATASLKILSDTIPLALAYYGSVLTIQGGYAQDLHDMVGATTATQDGIDAIDLAVSREPQNTSIRLLRIENGLSVSRDSPFKRWDVIKVDLDYVSSLPKGTFSSETQAKLLVFAGDLAMGRNQVNQAVKDYRRAIKLAPASLAATWAKARLEVLE